MSNILTEINALHDAIVRTIKYEKNGIDDKLELTLQSDYQKTSRITFANSIVVASQLFNYLAHDDSFDYCTSETSNLKDLIKPLEELGIGIPEIQIKLVFHSGSKLEIACAKISIE